MNMSRCVAAVLGLVVSLSGCQTAIRQADQSSDMPESSSDDSGDASIRLSGDLGLLLFPANPQGANRILTATVKGGRVRTVWLAPRETSQERALLTKVGEGEYQINLYGGDVYEVLKGQNAKDCFRVLAEMANGSLAMSISVRYAMQTAAQELDSSWDFPWDKATTTIYQRTSKKIPGSRGQLRLRLDDITAGQVLVTVCGPGRTRTIDTTSMRPGAAAPLILGGREYVLVLDELFNLLVGRDFAVFSLVSRDVWEKEKISRLLKVIEASDATFIRDGQEMTGTIFAAHLREKLEFKRFKPDDLSIDLFIDEVASRSGTSGNPYQVRQPDGQIIDASTWMRQRAIGIDKEKGGNVAGDSTPVRTTGSQNNGR